MSAADAAKQGPAAKRYASGQATREPFLLRARRISSLTVPSLFREYGANGTTDEAVPWQSLGGYGVNNLSAKVVLALFPPGIPFINLKQDKKALQALAQLPEDVRGKLKTEIDKGLSGVEMEFIEGVEEDGDRYKIFDVVRHLVVGGNHCIQIQKDATLKGHALENYITIRDNSGEIVDAVIEDQMAWETAPADIQDMATRNGYEIQRKDGGNGEPLPDQAPLYVYTRIARLPNMQYKVYQECWGERVSGSEYTYDADALPYLFLRMVSLKKEHYGRSYCEDYEGDLQTLDGHWQVLTEGGAAIAQLKWLVKPGGVTNKDAFAKAANGAVLTGDPEDVAAVRSEKAQDLSVVAQQADKLELRLSKIFLLYSSIQRNGERVTAEEIATVRRDLEASMGGVYSNQVTTFQTPYARLKMQALQRNGRVTKLPKGTVKMTILTGDAGLGRAQKAQTLIEFLQQAATALGDPKILAPYLQVGTFLQRLASNLSIDTDGLIKTDDEVQQDMQQQQQTQTMQAIAPEAVRQGGQMIQNAQTANLDAAANPPPADAAPQQPQPQPAQ